jgi:hypothetical protein
MWTLLLAVLIPVFGSSPNMAWADDDPSRVQVILIGVEKSSASKDAALAVDRLAKVLTRENGSQPVLRFDTAAGSLPPTLESLRKKARVALENLSATDRAIVYYRGQVLKANGRVYLEVEGTDPQKLATTALPLEELRKWLDEDDGDSEALLLLDAPGASLVEAVPGARHYLLGRGSGGDFGSWVAAGLAGAADSNGDATITIAELQENLLAQARASAGRPIPIRKDPPIGPEGGLVDLITLEPRNLTEAIGELSAWADAEARRDSGSCVEVRPFGFKGQEDTTHASTSLAGSFAAVLKKDAGDAYRVVGPPGRSRPTDKESASHLLQGTYQRLAHPERLLVHVELSRESPGRVLGQSTRVILVDDVVRSQIFDEGVSSTNMLTQLDSEGCPVKVELFCAGQTQAIPFEDAGPNGIRVRVPRGSQYRIRVANNLRERLFVRLLIDGVNTVIQSDSDTDVLPCLLDHARGYVIEPLENSTYEGWVLKVGKEGKVAPFQFVPYGQSKANQLGARGEVGVIHLAFYREASAALALKGVPNPDQLGTAAAAVIQRTLPVAAPMRIDPKPILILKIAYEPNDRRREPIGRP